MDPILEFGLETTRWLQQSYPQLRGFMVLVSQLSTEEFYLAMVPLLYWCVNKRFTVHLSFVFLGSLLLNNIGKQAFRGPRPFWLDPSVGASEELSYGVPSGHVQSTTVFYLFIAYWLQRPLLTLLALVMIFLMALSRVYLGVHFVHDALLGFALSVLVIVAYAIWRRYYAKEFAKRILGQRLFLTLTVPILGTIVYILLRLLIGQPDLSVPWASFIPVAEVKAVEGMTTAVGGLIGLAIGSVLENSRVRFRADGLLWKRGVRFILGAVVLAAIWAGLGQLFPRDPLWLAIPLRLFRYALTTLWISYYAPLLFVRLNLAAADPEPEFSLRL